MLYMLTLPDKKLTLSLSSILVLVLFIASSVFAQTPKAGNKKNAVPAVVKEEIKTAPASDDSVADCSTLLGALLCNPYNLPKKKPIAGLVKWGFDERIRQEYWKNTGSLNKNANNSNYMRFRTRLWFEADPWQWLNLYVRFTNEFRAWFSSHAASDLDEVVFDNIYFKIKRPFGLPITAQMGRMDLKYGDGFVIMEGNPLDGSRTRYVDGIKGTLHLDDFKTDIDALVLDLNRTDNKFFKFNPSDKNLNEDQVRLYGYYLTSKLLSEFNDLKIEQYYLYKDSNGRTDALQLKLSTFGGRVSGKIIDNLTIAGEIAGQFGKQGAVNREGLGGKLELRYAIPDFIFSPVIKTGYMGLSGDDPDTQRIEAWDPVLSRWFSPNVLMWSLLSREYPNSGNRPAYWSNLHMYHVGMEACLFPWWKFLMDYQSFWCDENTFKGSTGFGNGNKRGDLIQIINKIKFNKNWSSDCVVETFSPGGYYGNSPDSAVYFRWQIVFQY